MFPINFQNVKLTKSFDSTPSALPMFVYNIIFTKLDELSKSQDVRLFRFIAHCRLFSVQSSAQVLFVCGLWLAILMMSLMMIMMSEDENYHK